MKQTYCYLLLASIVVCPISTIFGGSVMGDAATSASAVLSGGDVNVAVPEDPDFSFQGADDSTLESSAKKGDAQDILVEADAKPVDQVAALQEVNSSGFDAESMGADQTVQGDSLEVGGDADSVSANADVLLVDSVNTEDSGDRVAQDEVEKDMSVSAHTGALLVESVNAEDSGDRVVQDEVEKDLISDSVDEQASTLKPAPKEGAVDELNAGVSSNEVSDGATDWNDSQVPDEVVESQQVESKEEVVAPVMSHEQLDSVEDGPGNWFFKAKIMKRARAELNEIRKLSDKIQALREPNQKMAEALDARFDSFYNECGFQKGEIVVTLKYIEEQLDLIKREHVGEVKKDQPPAVLETIKDLEEKRDLLKQVEEDFAEVMEDDKLARELFALLSNEIGRAHQYLDVALEKYEDIENTLNDETAEFNLHAIEASKANIENIEQYLTGDFANFYSRLSSRVDTLMSSIRAELQKLRDMGIELNRKIREERERQEQERIAAEKRKKEEALQKIEDAKLWNRINRFGGRIWEWGKKQAAKVVRFFAQGNQSEVAKSS